MEASIKKIFFRFFDHVIPDDFFENQSHSVRLRAYIFVGFTLGNMILSLMGYFVALLIAQMGQETVLLGGGLALVSLIAYAFVLRLFVTTRSFVLAGNFFAATAVVTITISIFYSGGYHSPVLEMLVMVPIFVYLMSGRAAGITWMLIILVLNLGFYFLYAANITMPQLIIHPALEWFVQMCSWVMLYTAILAALIVYDSMNEKLSKKLESERNFFEYQAAHDSLTELANRAFFQNQLEVFIEECQKNKTRMALALVDLDDFKKINDEYGHLAGDEVLKVVASRLKGGVRSTDLAARIGGDEFALLLRNVTSANDVKKLFQKLIESISLPIRFNRDLTVTCSIGVAFCPDHGEDEDSLTHHADEMLYAAKENKNCCKVRQFSAVS